MSKFLQSPWFIYFLACNLIASAISFETKDVWVYFGLMGVFAIIASVIMALSKILKE